MVGCYLVIYVPGFIFLVNYVVACLVLLQNGNLREKSADTAAKPIDTSKMR